MIKGTAQFAPWQDDPDPPDYWEDDDYAAMRAKLRKYWASNVRDDWQEALHPRDEEGKFTFVGSSGSTSVTGLPKDAKLHDRLMGQAFERKAFVSEARQVEASRWESGRRIEVTTTALIPDKGVDKFVSRPANGKVAYYNPKLADLTTANRGEQYIEFTHAQPKPGLATEIEPLPGEGIMYRGMRAEEYEKFLKTGEIVSTGKYNMSGQEGLTYWADHPSTAESYANSFAPWPHKATFERPAFVVAAKIPTEVRKVEGTGENEIGVARPITRDEVLGVWRGDVYQHTPGVSEFREVAENDFSFSNGAAPSSQLVWSKVVEGQPEPGIAPLKTVKAYKQFEMRGGKLYPLFIGAKTATPQGEWIAGTYIPTKGYAERPGWHAGILPIAPHLRRRSTGKMSESRVWAEVELPADIDYQPEADKSSTRDIRGKVPAGGFYRFKTNKMQGGAWMIGGAVKVNRILENEEVAELLNTAGYSKAEIAGEMRPVAASATIKLGGEKPTKQRIEAAVEEAYKELHPNPLANRQVGFGNEAGTGVVMMELENYNESLYVKWMMAHPHKGGMGTQGMDYLKELATKHNVPLTLTPWKTGELGEKKLTRIFNKWGFKLGKQGLMWWHPNVRKSDAVLAMPMYTDDAFNDARPWDESLYERGQPENKGQFASKPGGGGGAGGQAGPKPGGVKSRAHAGKSVAGERPSAAQVLAAAKGNRPFGRFMKAAVLAQAGLRKEAEEMVRPAGEAARARIEAERAAAQPAAAPAGPKKATTKEDFDKAGIRLRFFGGHAGNMEQKEKEALDHWNAIVDMPPQEFKDTFMGGMKGPMVLTADPDQDKYKVTGDILGEGNLRGINVAHFERDIDLKNKRAYSALFEVSGDAQKAGIGKRLLAGNIEAYEKMGIEKVGVTAGLSVGGYAWAKYGYVPDQQSWDDLRSLLKGRMGGSGSQYSGNRGSDTVEAQDWDELGEVQQDQVRTRWRQDSHEEFLQSEIDNWRDSGEPLAEGRRRTASEFNGGGVMDMPLWAEEAMDELTTERRDDSAGDYPYSDKQLYAAMELVNSDDENAEFELKWDDDKLNTYVPPGGVPGQMSLPGIEEVKPADYLTPEMREEISERLIKAAESKADDDSINIDPPEYLRESVNEYMSEYWDQMDTQEQFDIARRYDLHNIEIEPDDEQIDEDMAAARESAQGDPVMAALDDPNPKAIWRVADSSRGKELLLGRGWGGTLNLKDPESYKRFKDYVGRAKKDG